MYHMAQTKLKVIFFFIYILKSLYSLKKEKYIFLAKYPHVKTGHMPSQKIKKMVMCKLTIISHTFNHMNIYIQKKCKYNIINIFFQNFRVYFISIISPLHSLSVYIKK